MRAAAAAATTTSSTSTTAATATYTELSKNRNKQYQRQQQQQNPSAQQTTAAAFFRVGGSQCQPCANFMLLQSLCHLDDSHFCWRPSHVVWSKIFKIPIPPAPSMPELQHHRGSCTTVVCNVEAGRAIGLTVLLLFTWLQVKQVGFTAGLGAFLETNVSQNRWI